MNCKIPGLHHVTAIASDPQRNLDFYVGLLGLRFVKRTVNFDDPGSYHFYFGDNRGTPGTILTFLPWPGARRGIRGTAQVEATAFAISPDSVAYWLERLKQHDVTAEKTSSRFGEEVIRLLDPDGLLIELIASSGRAKIDLWADSPVAAEHALRGFHSVSAALEGYERTARLLTDSFGYRLIDESGNRFRFASSEDSAPGRIVDLLCQPDTAMGRAAAGSVHHIAFRAKDRSRTTPVPRASHRSWLQRHACDGSRLFSFHLFPRARRRAVRNRDWTARFHVGRKTGGTRYAFTPAAMAGTGAVADRTDSPTYSSARKIMRPQPDFIHEFVPGTSNRTLLLLHGTGGNERDLIALGRELDPNPALLSPRGKVLENGMPRFFRRFAEGVFDLKDLKYRTNELADFVIAAAQHYRFATDQLVAVGYSNGANFAASMLLLRPEILSAAILFRAMVPLYPETQPNLSSVRVWIGAGTNDPIIPMSEANALDELLRNAGADVTVRYSQAGHELTMADVESAREWLTTLE
jgi:predicted esterase/catechol 2,3-dioxygenase-like lactoylglutathione lyase family enzyme